MKRIFSIYKSDLKDIFSNKVLLVIVVGLIILPSLYAWFNIVANWDPYGSTKNIKVAVVNKDSGAKVQQQSVNVGNKLIAELKTNNSLGWQFVDEKTAENGVKKGDYYASILIPQNFSKDLTSLISKDVKKGKIIYTFNDKINAISSKITDKGASTIQTQVNETVVETVSEIILQVSNSLGIELENQIPKLSNLEKELKTIQNKFNDIQKMIDLGATASVEINGISTSLKNDIPKLNKTLNNANTLASDIKIFLQNSKKSLDNISPILKDDISLVANISNNICSSIKTLITALETGTENTVPLIENLQSKLVTLKGTNEAIISFLKTLTIVKPHNAHIKEAIKSLKYINTKIDPTINVLNTIKEDIKNGKKPDFTVLKNSLKVMTDINKVTNNILNAFDEQIKIPIDNIFNESYEIADDVISVLNSTQNKLPQIENILTTILSLSDKTNENLTFVNDKLPKAKSIVDELVNTITTINESKDVKDIIGLLKNDIISRSDFLKQPVELVTNRLYPVANYGAGMTPFYTILSLWVGVLILMSLLSVNVHKKYKPYEIYLGRGLTFLTLAILQGLVVSVGDLYILNVEVLNPLLFILISMFTSFVFTLIVYSLVSVFKNIGKAICVVLLVIQVAASGGTFPVQIIPEFFRYINPFLPFTYSISALRETVGGIYEYVLIKDLVILIIFAIIPLVFTLIFKGIIDKYTKPISDKLNSSELIGH